MKKILFALIASACLQLSAHAQTYNIAFETLAASGAADGIIATNNNLAINVTQTAIGPGSSYSAIEILPDYLTPNQVFPMPIPYEVTAAYPLTIQIAGGSNTIKLQNIYPIARTFRVSLAVRTTGDHWDTYYTAPVTMAANGGTAMVSFQPFTKVYNTFPTGSTVTVLKMGLVAL